MVDTRDDQLVFVGSECFKQITEAGWQPPKGGPRLYPLPKPPYSPNVVRALDLAHAGR